VRVGAEAAHREFDAVRLAEHDHAGADQLARERGGMRRDALLPHFRAARRHTALQVDDVLQRDRDAVERADAVPGGNRLIGCLRRTQCFLRVDGDECVQLFSMACDAGEENLGQLRRGECAPGHVGRQFVYGCEREIVIACCHLSSSS